MASVSHNTKHANNSPAFPTFTASGLRIFFAAARSRGASVSPNAVAIFEFLLFYMYPMKTWDRNNLIAALTTRGFLSGFASLAFILP